jgi:hypothetical protein
MKQRTIQQNKSLHLWFQLLADDLNNAGYTVRKTLKEDFELDWTPTLIKEILFKSIIRAKFNKSKTSELTSGELQLAFDEINRHLGEKFGIHTPFPSLEVMIEQLGKVDYPKEEYDPDF